MGRRKKAVKRTIQADVMFDDVLVAKFVNQLMKCGKKNLSQGILYGAFEQIASQKTGRKPLEVFKRAIDNVKPVVEVRSRRVGGATYQVPMEVRPERRTSLAIRWIIGYARDRKGHSMREKLAHELFDAFNGTGGAINKKEDVHRMAEANKAFAHYRW